MTAGQYVVSRSGFTFKVVSVGKKWIAVQGVRSNVVDHYTHEWFKARFVDPAPKNDFKEKKPKQGELL